MADYREQIQGRVQTRENVEMDMGLRAFMLSIYNYMATALVVTALAALAIANLATTNDPSQAVGTLGNGTMLTSLGAAVYTSPLRWVIMFAPLAFILVLQMGLNKLSKSSAIGLFYAFAAIMGISISWIFMVYTGGSIVQTFFVTAASFGALSLFGYTTKRNLSGMGSFLMMGLFGLIIASVVNFFLGSGPLAFAINVIGVLIFAGLTAYDTQRLKEMYVQLQHQPDEVMTKSSIMGSLSLYLNFINMFMFLLSFMGNRE